MVAKWASKPLDVFKSGAYVPQPIDCTLIITLSNQLPLRSTLPEPSMRHILKTQKREFYTCISGAWSVSFGSRAKLSTSAARKKPVFVFGSEERRNFVDGD